MKIILSFLNFILFITNLLTKRNWFVDPFLDFQSNFHRIRLEFMPTKITCCICGNKHQSARNSELCKNIKGDLPLFTDFLRENDRSNETSFARSQIAPNAIRRIMSFMHARKDDFRKWSKENPRAEIRENTISSKKRKLEKSIPQPILILQNTTYKKVKRESEEESEESEELEEESEVKTVLKGPAPPLLRYEHLLKCESII